ncbi:hypothetical protein TRIP_B220092 [uncultured Desulfatiglans sp.]|uniref:Uncharacterized protein n=1 Tax=Uncultured Desulfatiglans sp. TaxID=1748965 RepID=A0A653A4A5_UNCDX|nr:hypothetical protein TRIP_B220092 [uncultured Desulfatiglans sp.]
MYEKARQFLSEWESATDRDAFIDETWNKKAEYAQRLFLNFWALCDNMRPASEKGRFLERIGWAAKQLSRGPLDHSALNGLIMRVDGEEAPLSEDIVAEIFELFMTPNYEPPLLKKGKAPDPFTETLLHFHCLWIFYALGAAPDSAVPLSVALKMDLVLTQLAEAGAAAYMLACQQIPDKERTQASAAQVAQGKTKRMQRVIEAFYRVEIPEGAGPDKTARLVREYLARKLKNPPSQSTVKRYLRDEGLIS